MADLIPEIELERSFDEELIDTKAQFGGNQHSDVEILKIWKETGVFQELLK